MYYRDINWFIKKHNPPIEGDLRKIIGYNQRYEEIVGKVRGPNLKYEEVTEK